MEYPCDTEKLELYDMSHIIPKLDSFQVFVKDCVRTTRVKLKKLCYRTNGTKAYTIELGRTWEICEALKNLSRSQPSPHGVIRNCEKDDKKLGTRKAVNEFNECELVTAASLGMERAPWKEESLQALQNLFAEEISLQSVTMSLVREKIQSDPILCKESPIRVYGRIRAEWRHSSQTAW